MRCYFTYARRETRLFAQKFKALAGEIPPVRKEEVALYEKHYALLRKWNEQINLVSRKSIETAFAAHYIDSLFISDFAFPHIKEDPVFDVGTGAGFPGLLFAIRYPQTRITLFEKSLKKQSFLLAAVSGLELPNVQVMGGFPEEKLRGFFFARAVFPREDLFKFFRTRALPGSRFVANVGGKAELTPPPKAFQKKAYSRYSLPEEAGDRQVELFSLCST